MTLEDIGIATLIVNSCLLVLVAIISWQLADAEQRADEVKEPLPPPSFDVNDLKPGRYWMLGKEPSNGREVRIVAALNGFKYVDDGHEWTLLSSHPEKIFHPLG